MKRLLSRALLLIYFFPVHAHSSSFLMPRSVTHNATLELALATYHIYRDPTADCSSWDFYVTPFYMQSHNSNQIARSFLPNNNCTLNIQENGSGNICSLWLDLIAPPGLFYSSTMTLSPVSKTVGGYFYGRFYFGNCCDTNSWWIHNAWFSLSCAAMRVTHALNIEETLTGNMAYGTIPCVTTGIQAFNNPHWCYGKLSPHAHSDSGIDDIQLKLGTNYYSTSNKGRIGCYLVGTIPTGTKPHAQVLFEPLVGTRHGALGGGIMGDYTGPIGEHGQWSLLSDLKYRYLFSGREIRSCDLAGNGDWSRYMLFVNAATTSLSFPAINNCTLPVNVTPRSQIEYWLAMHYAHCAWNVELGYNVWWRATDAITPLCSLPAHVGIYDLAGTVSGNPTSASQANISQSAIGPNQAPSDAVFTPSTRFNCASAAQQSTATNSLYLAFSYNGDVCDEYPWLCGIGGGYEWALHHALAQGSIWAKLGILF